MRGLGLYQSESAKLLVVTLALLWAVIVLLPQRMYLGSDDATIAAIVHGTLSGQAEPRAIFISFPLGLIISLLARAFPGPGWYAIVMWTILGVTVAGGGLAIARLVHQGRERVIPLTLLILTALPLLLRLSFTTIAILGGAIAFLLLYAGAARSADYPRHSNELFIWSVAIGAMAFATRFEGFVAALLAMLPVIVVAVVQNVRRGVTALTVMGLLCALIFGVTQWAYSSQEWRTFLEYNTTRSRVLDYFHDNPAAGAQAADWTHNDRELLRNYTFFDPEVHNADRLREYLESTQRVVRAPHLSVVADRGRQWLIVALSGVLLASLGRVEEGMNSRNGLGLGILVWTVVVAAAIGYWRFKWHVIDGVVGGGFLASHVIALQHDIGKKIQFRRSLIWVVLSLVVLAGGLHTVIRAGNIVGDQSSAKYFEQHVAPLKNYSDRVLISQASAVQTWAVDPLTQTDAWSTLPIISSGWQTFSPPWWRRTELLGTEWRAMAVTKRDHVFLAREPEAVDQIRVLLRERYGLEPAGCRDDIGQKRIVVSFSNTFSGCEYQ